MLRRFGTEKCDLGNCAIPHPQPPPRFFRRCWNAAKNFAKNMKQRSRNDIKRHLTTSNDIKRHHTSPRDAPNPPFGDPKSMLGRNIMLNDFWNAKGTLNGSFSVPKALNKHAKKSLEIRYRKNSSFDAKTISK